MPRYYSLSWEQRFHDLLEFREKNGHCKVPQFYRANQPLANWVKNQRNSYKVKQRGKRSSLTDEREAALNAIGFNWTLRNWTFRNKVVSQGPANSTTGKRKSSCTPKILPVTEVEHGGINNKRQRQSIPPSPETSHSVDVFPIGTTFMKSFEGFGIFRGKVTRVPNDKNPFYGVEYEDDDEEDLSHEELLDLSCKPVTASTTSFDANPSTMTSPGIVSRRQSSIASIDQEKSNRFCDETLANQSIREVPSSFSPMETLNEAAPNEALSSSVSPLFTHLGHQLRITIVDNLAAAATRSNNGNAFLEARAKVAKEVKDTLLPQFLNLSDPGIDIESRKSMFLELVESTFNGHLDKFLRGPH